MFLSSSFRFSLFDFRKIDQRDSAIFMDSGLFRISFLRQEKITPIEPVGCF